MSAPDPAGDADIRYRRARSSDRRAVLDVLATANFERVPSPEMPELGLDRMFVAERAGALVGVAGYRVESPGAGKTTLMAVRPECRERGIGARLQELRLDALSASGCRTVRTNADRPETVAWYERRFGYRRVGRVAKVHAFGLADVDHWTTLELDLEGWQRQRGAPGG